MIIKFSVDDLDCLLDCYYFFTTFENISLYNNLKKIIGKILFLYPAFYSIFPHEIASILLIDIKRAAFVYSLRLIICYMSLQEASVKC